MLDRIYRAFRARPFFYAAVVIAFAAAVFTPQEPPPRALERNRGRTAPQNAESDLPDGRIIIEGKIADWPTVRADGRANFALLTAAGEKIAVFARDAPDGFAFAKGRRVKVSGIPRRPREARNPGEFDYKKYLAIQGVRLTLFADEKPQIAPVDDRILPDRIAAAVRRRAVEALKKNIPREETAALLIQMLIGAKEEAARGLRPYFSNTGTAHVLVISGLHVGYITAIFWYTFRLLGLSLKTAGAVTLPFLWTYAIATGAAVPVIRASIMSSAVIISSLAARGYDSYQALGLAAAVTLLANPREIFSAGFQLSYAATFGIIHILRNIRIPVGKIPAAPKYVILLLWVSTAAQIFTSPIIVRYFGKLSALSWAANLIIVPAAGASLAMGLAVVAAHQFAPPAAKIAGFLSGTLLDTSVNIIKKISSVPGTLLSVGSPSAPFMLIYYSASLAIPLLIKNGRCVAAGAFAACSLAALCRPPPQTACLIATFLDVEGECALIETPAGDKILVGAGGSWSQTNVAGRSLIPFLKNKNITRLDAVILAAPDISRYGALEETSREIPITRVYVSPQISTWEEYLNLMDALDKQRTPVIEIWSPHRIISGDTKINIIPARRSAADPSRNALSVVVERRGRKIYFPPGSEPGVEAETARSIGKADILFLSANNAGAAKTLVDQLRPDYAIINGRGKSSAEKTPGGLLRTSECGAVTIEIGDKIKVVRAVPRKTETPNEKNIESPLRLLQPGETARQDHRGKNKKMVRFFENKILRRERGRTPPEM